MASLILKPGPKPKTDTCGFIFAATGEKYTILAQRAARSLRLVMADANIDLFTDQPVNDAIFDQVHQMDRFSHRPKMEAMRRSRFEKTVYLDADILVLTDVSDLFDTLERCDMAGALGNQRTQIMSPPDAGVPRSYPVINAGVIALRKSPQVSGFLTDWEAAVLDNGHLLDQPELRRLMYHSNLNFQTLAPEYNLIHLALLNTWRVDMGAPRILHCRRLHDQPPGDPEIPIALNEVLTPVLARHVRGLLERDWSLGGEPGPLRTPLSGLRAELRKKQDIIDRQDRMIRRLDFFGLVRGYGWLSRLRAPR
jgi:hypothetical protein